MKTSTSGLLTSSSRRGVTILQRDVRIEFLEVGDVGAEPERGETRRATDAERAADALAVLLLAGIAEHRQRLAHVVGIAAAARRQADALADPLQQVEAEIALEQPQLVADGAARQVQFVGGPPDAAMAGETVERAQRLGRWYSQGTSSEVNEICGKDENISLFEPAIHCFPGDVPASRRSGSAREENSVGDPGSDKRACLRRPGRPQLSAWTRTIFDFGETAWREYQSAAWYVELLKREGFSVETGSGGMPTAFCAHWTNGAGPTVGLYAEYDAVPGNCQDAGDGQAAAAGSDRPCRRTYRSAFRARHRQPRRPARHQGGDAAARHQGHAALHRRAGREGARLEAHPRGQGLLRRSRRDDLVPSLLHAAALQHGALGYALWCRLRDDLPLRLRSSPKAGVPAMARPSRSRIRTCGRLAPTTR